MFIVRRNQLIIFPNAGSERPQAADQIIFLAPRPQVEGVDTASVRIIEGAAYADTPT